MSDNMIPPSSGADDGLGQTLRLTSLAPKFNKDRHQLYLDLLVRAIDAEGTKNIALTGAYGTGKSSVLEQLIKDRTNRVIDLSLSTIAPELHDGGTRQQTATEERSSSRTNQIQKEIVKQLLYRLPPDSVPRSRFRRVRAPEKARDLKLAGFAGASAYVVLMGLGLIQPLVEGLLSEVWRQTIAYVLLLVVSVCAARAVLGLARSRLLVSASVQTGPATITLSNQSDTYFDEYLDEIVYFFQVSRRDIVVIEDIDRFEDVQVFDTLRALNGLLNSSDQIGRRIVFVYAIRDSVFEQIGAKEDESEKSESDTDRAKKTLKRASRTKFFDVIIPLIPFVSADNARDVMSEVMTSNDFEIDPALIRLAARHVADMRMMHNIRNEFEVYRSRLVVPQERVPGINDDLVFGIVLLKNTHLGDFEKIRHRDSTLDRLYSIWRALVREELAKRTRVLARHLQNRHSQANTGAQASRLGRRLTEFSEVLQAAARASMPQATVELSGPATPTNVEDPGIWSRIASDELQQLTLHDPTPRPYYPSTMNLSFSAEQLASLLGTSLDPHKWEEADLRETNSKIEHEENQLRFLRHHTWEELCERTEFTVDLAPFKLTDSSGTPIDGSGSFDKAVEIVLESDLARDLVRHGFLTSHFALYASSYYGNHLGPEAMEYIRRCIEPGIPDASFSLSESDVVQLLREQDAEKNDAAALFSDPSVFNISVLNYLLAQRPAAAATVARRLSRLGDDEQAFIDTYVAQGDHPGALLATIAPHWTEVVRYAAVSAPVDPSARPALLDAVLAVLPGREYAVDQAVGQVLELCYRDITTVCQPDSKARAELALQIVQASGAVLKSLEPLNNEARQVAIRLRLFPITETNLRVLVPSGVVALDVLRNNGAAYAHTLDRIDDYLALAATSPNQIQIVSDPTMFSTVVTDAARELNITRLGELIDRSTANCRVDALSNVPAEAWPLLVAGARTNPTFENVTIYVEKFGMDENLGALLAKHKTISGSERFSVDDRRVIAVTVLASSKQIPSTSTRVRIAASVQPGTIEATDVTPERGDLVARLLKRRLLADDATAFSNELMIDWPTLETSIGASKKYAKFVKPEVLQVSFVPNLLRSSVVPKEAKLAVASTISAYAVECNPRQTREIADALIDTGWGLPYESLEALRAAGGTGAQLVALIAARGDRLPIEQLKALLASMGGDYAKVAVGGRGRPAFRVDPSHEYVLSRLVGNTVKRVTTQSFKLKGQRLVATLATTDTR